MRRFLFLLALLGFGCEKSNHAESHPPASIQKTIPTEHDRSPTTSPASDREDSVPATSLSNDRGNAPSSTHQSGDQGIFTELDPQLSLDCPTWLSDAPWTALRIDVPASSSQLIWRALSGVPLCPKSESADSVIRLAKGFEFKKTSDADRDGIPDSIDILRGAKKTVLNGAAYRGGYHDISFPGGDVPRNEGVCTDVVIRALRNAGFDLQALVAEDIKKRPEAYPMVKKADSNIDHRRVRTLLPYFEKHFAALPTQVKSEDAPFFPGDILFMNTLGDAAPEHMGIVSDQLGKSGLPLIINNWTDGTKTSEMDLLTFVPVTHRFRIATPISVPQAQQGLDGLVSRSSLQIPEETRQAISVVTTLWSSSAGWLTRWTRASATGSWTIEGAPSAVVLGSAGLGQGRGLGASSRAPHKKAGGDKRAPAGVFRLGTAFGRPAVSPYAGSYPYRSTSENDYWVDDSNAPEYNTWQQLAPGRTPPWSAERLTMYRLGLVVEHNTSPIQPGAGSAIFIHPWQSESTPTVGCTALPLTKLQTLLGWLDVAKKPVLVQTAGHIF